MINNTHYMEYYSQIERTKIAEEIKTKLLYLNQNLVDIPEIKYLMVALDLFEKYGLECRRVLVIGNPKKMNHLIKWNWNNLIFCLNP